MDSTACKQIEQQETAWVWVQVWHWARTLQEKASQADIVGMSFAWGTTSLKSWEQRDIPSISLLFFSDPWRLSVAFRFWRFSLFVFCVNLELFLLWPGVLGDWLRLELDRQLQEKRPASPTDNCRTRASECWVCHTNKFNSQSVLISSRVNQVFFRASSAVFIVFQTCLKI